MGEVEYQRSMYEVEESGIKKRVKFMKEILKMKGFDEMRCSF